MCWRPFIWAWLLRIPEVVVEIPMYGVVLQRLPHLDEPHLGLDPRDLDGLERLDQAREQVVDGVLHALADPLQLITLGPGADRRLLYNAFDVGKACLLEVAFHLLGSVPVVHASRIKGLVDQFIKGQQEVVWLHGIVVTLREGMHVLKFDPSSGPYVSIEGKSWLVVARVKGKLHCRNVVYPSPEIEMGYRHDK